MGRGVRGRSDGRGGDRPNRHRVRLVQFREESHRVRNALIQEGRVLKKGAQGSCANCSNPVDHSAQKLLTEHSRTAMELAAG